MPARARRLDRLGDIGPRVALVEVLEDGLAQRLRGGDDEHASAGRELLQEIAMGDQVLDLRGEVEGELRHLRVELTRQPERMRGAVQKIGIAEGDVCGARRHLLADVREDDVARHREEPAAVHGRDRAVAAEMPAAAARLDVPGRIVPAAALDLHVRLKGRELRAARDGKVEAPEMGPGRLCLRPVPSSAWPRRSRGRLPARRAGLPPRRRSRCRRRGRGDTRH